MGFFFIFYDERILIKKDFLIIEYLLFLCD